MYAIDKGKKDCFMAYIRNIKHICCVYRSVIAHQGQEKLDSSDNALLLTVF